jgi:hypothetical protein
MSNGEAHRSVLPVATVAALAALVTVAATVRYVGSDPAGSLLVSEQLLTNGTTSLDAYPVHILDDFWTFVQHEGRTHYYWALGSSLASTPFVALFLLVGVDIVTHERVLQLIVAATLAAVTVLLMYRLAVFFVAPRTSVLLSAVFWYGSSLASVTGTALWSHNWAVVWGLIALICVVGGTLRGWRWAWAPLAAALALAYVTRPTMALLALVLLPYVTWRDRRLGLLTGAALAALLALWVAFSLAEFNSWLPPYYRVDRLAADDPWAALVGLLASPARGLLVYLPLLLLIPALAMVPRPHGLAHRGLIAAMAVWGALLLVAVSRFPDWYGGWSYGPRLLTELIPAVFLATVLVWPPSFPSGWPRALAAGWILLAGWGVWVHTVQGLFNPWTAQWNGEPNVNEDRRTLWDWRYPPFLHNEERHEMRLEDYRPAPPDIVSLP